MIVISRQTKKPLYFTVVHITIILHSKCSRPAFVAKIDPLFNFDQVSGKREEMLTNTSLTLIGLS